MSTDLPLFFLHGFTGSAELSQRFLSTSFADLKISCDAVALPLGGHSPATTIGENHTFAREVERLLATIRAELAKRNKTQCNLAGYSMGGRIALALCAAEPTLFARATVLSANPGLETEAERAARQTADLNWVNLLLKDGLAAFVARWEALPMWQTAKPAPQAALDAQRQFRLQHDPNQLALALVGMGPGSMPNLWTELSGVTMPVTWIAGGLDTGYVSIAQRACSMLPRALCVVIPSLGHNVLLEAPHTVARLLVAPPCV